MSIRGNLYRRGLWVHAQNLNRDSRERVIGSGFWSGRAWLHIRSKSLGLEWHFGRRAHFCGAGITFGAGDSENDILFFAGIPWLFALWFSVERLGWLHRVLPGEWHYNDRTDRFYKVVDARKISLDLYAGGLWWRLWAHPDGRGDNLWSGQRFRWQSGGFYPLDALLGRRRHSERDIEIVETAVPLPDGNYPARIRFFESQWKRPRWPFVERMVRADIELHRPIPIPGKGDNDFDQGEDAIYAMTVPAGTVPDAVAAVVQSALRDRRRR